MGDHLKMKDPARAADVDEGYMEEERDDAIIGTALIWSFVVFAVVGVSVAVGAYFMLRPTPELRKASQPVTRLQVRDIPAVPLPKVPFTDITQEVDIRFVHENGAYGDKLLPETMGGGVAVLDADGDGDQDLLFVNSQRWPWDPRPAAAPATMRLYLNDGKFQDATEGSGLDVSLYGMGVAVGDYDNDGLSDVFLSAVGPNRLFRNLGGGRFQDVTEAVGVAGDPRAWSTSCGWFDYDNDGDLDLFVANYVVWNKEFDLAQNFQLVGGGRAYGRPQSFQGTFPYLYRNDGGTFHDVTAEAGMQVRNKSASTDAALAKSLGVTFADVDRDGWIDVLVANDTVQNFLFHNRGDGTFHEIARECGVAFDTNGMARGAMGLDLSCFRNSPAIGIAIGNFSNEMTALYVNQKERANFIDEALSSGLGPNTRLMLTFGVLFFDYDLDGRLDLCAANGHLEEDIHRVQSSQTYEQPPQLFWNGGSQHGTEFLPVSAESCGSHFVRPMVGRGAAYADFDADGDLDLVLTASGRAPRLLRNDQQLGHHWLRVRLIGRRTNRDAIGSWVELQAGGMTQRRQVMPTRSYLSQVELPVTFGLGTIDRVDKLTIHWADGSEQEIAAPPIDRLLTVEQP
jgi:enediyne biosynthesis protein E4